MDFPRGPSLVLLLVHELQAGSASAWAPAREATTLCSSHTHILLSSPLRAKPAYCRNWQPALGRYLPGCRSSLSRGQARPEGKRINAALNLYRWGVGGQIGQLPDATVGITPRHVLYNILDTPPLHTTCSPSPLCWPFPFRVSLSSP